jgi:hypothetical protein
VYRLEINQPGFAEVSQSVEVHSSIPTDHLIELRILTHSESLSVSAVNTLIDPERAGSVNQVGSDFIQNRASSIPGRSLQDLVNSQPGWLYEGNAVLHPRGSEYQTQFVVDGIPLTDNRSPSFGPAIDTFEFQCDPSLSLEQCIYGPGGAAQTYGQAVVNRINFARSRIHPSFQVNASAGANVYESDRMNVRFQIDGQNLTDVLDVIDFGGLFSGNAIGPSRSFALRLTTNF